MSSLGRVVGLVLLAVALVASLTWSITRMVQDSSPAGVRLPEHLEQAVAAITRDDVDTLRSLLKAHPDLSRLQMEEEGSLLHLAARMNYPRSITLLVEQGALLDSRGPWRGTPLHWACWWGNAEAVQTLLDRGAKLEERGDDFGSTPLLWAAHGSSNLHNPRGHYEQTVRVLLDRGAAADTCNSKGVSAFAIARGAIRDILQEHGATPAGGRQEPADRGPSRAPATRPTGLPTGRWA